MGGKRKKALPQRVDESKRQLMTWNMSDVKPSDLIVIPDNDPTLLQEQNASQSSNESSNCNDHVVCDMETSDMLNHLIENSAFYIPIARGLKLKGNQQFFHLGNICVKISTHQGTQLSQEPPLCDEVYLYINPDASRHMLYYEFFENDENQVGPSQSSSSPTKKTVLYYLVQSDLPVTFFESLQVKCFQLQYGGFDRKTDIITLQVFLSDSGLTPLAFPSEGRKMKKSNTAMQTLLTHFYGVTLCELDRKKSFNKKHDMDEVFRAVKEHHRENDPQPVHVNVQHPNLRPYLRSYQKRGILWMLTRENYGAPKTKQKSEEVHQLYEEIITLDGSKLYYNKYCGFVTSEMPVAVVSPPGGILADEMGLGKTVEVLACIMTHRRLDLPKLQPLPVLSQHQLEMKTCTKQPLEMSGRLADEDLDHITSVQSTSATHVVGRTYKNVTNQGNVCNNTVHDSVLKEVGKNENADEEQSENKYSDRPLHENSDAFDGVENMVKSSAGGEIFQQLPDNDKSMYWDIDGQRESFECICGAKEDATDYSEKWQNPSVVQCEGCKLWQHAQCVNYDLSDPCRGRFLCPHCHVSTTPVASGATLIITPSSISHQWVDEIFKHVQQESLTVFVYTGVNKQGFIQPQTLANQDIVITTYETLRKEIDYVDLPHSNSQSGRKLRRPKRYMATPSPITAVEWWRICLDEAQMVECTTTKTANMALRLSAVNRWCVTGTPIQKSLEDAYGLLLFLGQDPYWVHMWWKMLLYDPFCYGDKEALLGVLGTVLWRTCKKDVLDEICLPAQSDTVHWLSFSPVEDHFYKRQYQACSREALQKLRKFPDNSVKLSDLDRQTLHKLLYPLTRVRQACCHPQAVKGAFLPLHKSMMTMEELLIQLTKKAKQECEEAHRQFVAAQNGMAALCIVKEEYAEAVELYRDILRSVDEHKKELRTDELQQLHAMHNLNEVLQLKPQGVGPTLRDGDLAVQCVDIRTRYMQKAENFVLQGHQSWTQAKQTIRELQDDLKEGLNWWADTIHHFIGVGYGEQLVHKVKEDLSDSAVAGVDSILRKFRDARGLLFLLSRQLDELQTSHNRLTEALQGLEGAPADQALIRETVECCLRPARDKMGTCLFCRADELFDEYEGKLYCFVEKGVESHMTEEGTVEGHVVHAKRQGTWADSETEKAVKAVLSFAKSWNGNRHMIEYGNLHVKMFEAWKKEFKAMRTVWIETKANVGAVDELDMATTRIRLRLPGEPVSDPPQPNIIEACELAQQKLKFTSDQIIGKNELRKKLGQLLYLKNLSQTQGSIRAGKNPEPCPICQQELGSKWSVLLCGHCFCMECIRLMMDRYSFGGTNGSMKCPVCRQKTRHAEIAYVSTKKSAEESSGIKIKGDHSTKVEGILRCLLKIHQTDPEAKCLVFSTWHDILWVLAKALDDNEITYKLLSSYKFQNNLASFKHEKDIQVLLLPIHSGANGLNLIEATHVLLVEPILNPAQELQAIGRVHRIGQTKPTYVHRFIVKSTIEQKMHTLLQSSTIIENTLINSHKAEQTTFTVGDLKALFEDTDYGENNEDEVEEAGPSAILDANPVNGGLSSMHSNPEQDLTRDHEDDEATGVGEVEDTGEADMVVEADQTNGGSMHSKEIQALVVEADQTNKGPMDTEDLHAMVKDADQSNRGPTDTKHPQAMVIETDQKNTGSMDTKHPQAMVVQADQRNRVSKVIKDLQAQTGASLFDSGHSPEAGELSNSVEVVDAKISPVDEANERKSAPESKVGQIPNGASLFDSDHSPEAGESSNSIGVADVQISLIGEGNNRPNEWTSLPDSNVGQIPNGSSLFNPDHTVGRG